MAGDMPHRYNGIYGTGAEEARRQESMRLFHV